MSAMPQSFELMPRKVLGLILLAAASASAHAQGGFQVGVETYVSPAETAVGYQVPGGEKLPFLTGWEYGDDVELAGGAGAIAGFSFAYISNYDLTGGWTLRIYDIDPKTGLPRNELHSKSGDLRAGGGTANLRFDFDAVQSLPARFVYTLRFSGIGGGNLAGLIIPNQPPSVGTSAPGFLIRTARGWEPAPFTLGATEQGDLRITDQPAAIGGPIPLGQKVSLKVGALGHGPLAYQWRWNGVVMPGETASTLDLGPLTAQQGGYYEAAVSDGTGVVFSRPTVIQPDVPVLPFSDGFSKAASGGAEITGLSGVGRGNNLEATAETGEPSHGLLPPNASVWLSWRPDVTGVATISTLGSDFDTLLAVYLQPPFGAKGFPGLVRIAANDEAVGFTHASELQFNVIPGSTYVIAVDGKASRNRGGRGQLMLSWKTELTGLRLPSSTQSNPLIAVRKDDPVTMETQVSLPDGATAEIRWFRLLPDGSRFSGLVGSRLELKAITEAAVGRYYAEATVTYPDGTQRVIRVGLWDVQMRRGKNEDDDILAWDTFSLSRENAPTANVANRAPRIARSGLTRGTSGTQIFSSVGTTREDGEPAACGVVGSATSWYALLAEADGLITVDTAGSDFDTVLAVYTDTGEGPGLFDGLRPVICNDNASAADLTSSVQFCGQAGTVYFVQVAGAVGTVHLNFTMSNDASTCELASAECQLGAALQVVPANGQLVLAPEILAEPPYTVEWLHEGDVLPGESGPVLSLPAPPAGDYAVRLTSRFGQTVRPVARVRTVEAGQTGTGFAWLCDGGLRLQPAGAPNQTLVLERSADFISWTPIATNAPATGTFQFVVPATEQDSASAYRVRPQ